MFDKQNGVAQRITRQRQLTQLNNVGSAQWLEGQRNSYMPHQLHNAIYR